MTDLAEKNIAHWRGHVLLRPFVASGMLDLARFDAEQPAPLVLLESGETLSAETLCNPIVVFANYFFDSISQDSFVFQRGELFENTVTVTSTLAEPDLSDPGVLETISVTDDAASSGVIAFQAHMGMPMRVEFRNIRIKELP